MIRQRTHITQKVRAASILLVLLLAFFNGLSQEKNRNLLRGNRLFDLNKYNEAITYFEKATKGGTSKERKEATERLADCYRLLGNFEEAEKMYKRLINRGGGASAIFKYAMALKAAAKYQEAHEEFERYRELRPEDPQGRIFSKSCLKAQEWLNMEPDFETREMKFVNTPGPEFSPTPYANGLVFSSQRKGGLKPFISFDGGSGEVALDLFYVEQDGSDKSFENAPSLFPQLNTKLHDGTPTFTADGKEVYFVRTVPSDKRDENNMVINTLQIFYSKLDDNNKWSVPKPMFPHNSSKHSVFQPSISPDGRKILFVSDMEGGKGGTDIYICYKFGGEWSKPFNLGPDVNTFDFEVFPHFYNDSTFYFSSRGHPGMGQLDIFKTTFNKKEGWTNVTNLRAPINSIGNDMCIVFEKDKKSGFLVSDRINGTGAEDIYAFTKLDPIDIKFDGKHVIVDDRSLFNGIKVKIKKKGEKKSVEVPSINGKFVVEPEQNVSYYLYLRKDGFLYNKIEFTMARKGSEHKITFKPKKKPINVIGFIGEIIPKKAPKVDSLNMGDSTLTNAPAIKKRKRKHGLITRTMDEILRKKETVEDLDRIPYTGVTAKLRKGTKVIKERVSDLEGKYKFAIGRKKRLTIEIDTIPENYKEISDSLRKEMEKLTQDTADQIVLSDEEASKIQNELLDSLDNLAPKDTAQGKLEEIAMADTTSKTGDPEREKKKEKKIKKVDLAQNIDLKKDEEKQPEKKKDEEIGFNESDIEKDINIAKTVDTKSKENELKKETTLKKEESKTDKEEIGLMDWESDIEQNPEALTKNTDTDKKKTVTTDSKKTDVKLDGALDKEQTANNLAAIDAKDKKLEPKFITASGLVKSKGKPMADATLNVYKAGKFFKSYKTNSKGEFKIDLPKGATYTVTATKNGKTSEMKEIKPDDIASLGESAVNFDLGLDKETGAGDKKAIAVNDRKTKLQDQDFEASGVVQMGGKNLANASVKVLKNGRFFKNIKTNAKGEFKVKLPKGAKYSISATKNGKTSTTKEVDPDKMMALGESKVSLSLGLDKETGAGDKKAIAVNDRKTKLQKDNDILATGVVKMGGKTLTNAKVKVLKDGKYFREIRTNTKGEFSVKLPKGSKYAISATKNGKTSTTKEVDPDKLAALGENRINLDLGLDKETGAGDKKAIAVNDRKTKLQDQDFEASGVVQMGGKNLANASVKVLKNGRFFKNIKTNNKGEFKVKLPKGAKYSISATKNGKTSITKEVDPDKMMALGESKVSLSLGLDKETGAGDKKAIAVNDRKTKLQDQDFEASGVVQMGGKNLANASVKVLKNGRFFKNIKTNAKGEFKVKLPKGAKYSISATKNGKTSITKEVDPDKMMALGESKVSLSLGLDKETGAGDKKAIAVNDRKTKLQKDNDILATGVVKMGGKTLTNAKVKVLKDGKYFREIRTNTKGEFSVKLPKGSKYAISATKNGKTSTTKEVDPDKLAALGENRINLDLGLDKETGAGDKKAIVVNDRKTKLQDQDFEASGVVQMGGKNLANASVKVLKNGRFFKNIKTNAKGEFKVKLPKGAKYSISATKNGKTSITKEVDPDKMMALGESKVSLSLGLDKETGAGDKKAIAVNDRKTKLQKDNDILATGVVKMGGKTLTNAKVKVLKDGKYFREIRTNTKGEFSVKLPKGSKYAISATKNGKTSTTKEVDPDKLVALGENKINLDLGLDKETGAGDKKAIAVNDRKTKLQKDNDILATGVVKMGGKTLTNAKVKVLKDGKYFREIRTNTKGEFSVKLPKGSKYAISATKNGKTSTTKEVDPDKLAALGENKINLDLGLDKETGAGDKKAIAVNDRKTKLQDQDFEASGVVQMGGKNLANASVKVLKNGRFFKNIKTNNKGEFKVKLPKGAKYSISATKNGKTSITKEVDPDKMMALGESKVSLSLGLDKETGAGDKKAIAVNDRKTQLQKDNDILATGVVKMGGKTLTNAKVKVLKDGKYFREIRTNTKGEFSVKLPKGSKYAISATKNGKTSTTKEVDPDKLAALGENKINLDLGLDKETGAGNKKAIAINNKTASLNATNSNLKKERKVNGVLYKHDPKVRKGTILTEGTILKKGKPLPYAKVKIMKNGKFFREVKTNANGKFKANLPSNGKYSIMAKDGATDSREKVIFTNQLAAHENNVVMDFAFQKEDSSNNLSDIAANTKTGDLGNTDLSLSKDGSGSKIDIANAKNKTNNLNGTSLSLTKDKNGNNINGAKVNNKTGDLNGADLSLTKDKNGNNINGAKVNNKTGDLNGADLSLTKDKNGNNINGAKVNNKTGDLNGTDLSLTKDKNGNNINTAKVNNKTGDLNGADLSLTKDKNGNNINTAKVNNKTGDLNGADLSLTKDKNGNNINGAKVNNKTGDLNGADLSLTKDKNGNNINTAKVNSKTGDLNGTDLSLTKDKNGNNINGAKVNNKTGNLNGTDLSLTKDKNGNNINGAKVNNKTGDLNGTDLSLTKDKNGNNINGAKVNNKTGDLNGTDLSLTKDKNGNNINGAKVNNKTGDLNGNDLSLTKDKNGNNINGAKVNNKTGDLNGTDLSLTKDKNGNNINGAKVNNKTGDLNGTDLSLTKDKNGNNINGAKVNNKTGDLNGTDLSLTKDKNGNNINGAKVNNKTGDLNGADLSLTKDKNGNNINGAKLNNKTGDLNGTDLSLTKDKNGNNINTAKVNNKTGDLNGTDLSLTKDKNGNNINGAKVNNKTGNLNGTDLSLTKDKNGNNINGAKVNNKTGDLNGTDLSLTKDKNGNNINGAKVNNKTGDLNGTDLSLTKDKNGNNINGAKVNNKTGDLNGTDLSLTKDKNGNNINGAKVNNKTGDLNGTDLSLTKDKNGNNINGAKVNNKTGDLNGADLSLTKDKNGNNINTAKVNNKTGDLNGTDLSLTKDKNGNNINGAKVNNKTGDLNGADLSLTKDNAESSLDGITATNKTSNIDSKNLTLNKDSSNSNLSALNVDTKNTKVKFEDNTPIVADTNFKSMEVLTEGIVQNNGALIPYARIRIVRDGSFYKEVTADENGRFKVTLNRDGVYKLEALSEGHLPEEQTIVPGQMQVESKNIFLNFAMKEIKPEGEQKKVDFVEQQQALKKERIEKLFSVIPHDSTDIKTVGIVYNNDEAVTDATVHIFDGNKLMKTVKSDQYGRFAVPLPKDKKYTFKIMKENFETELKAFDPKTAQYKDHLYLDFQISKVREKDAKPQTIHFIGSVSSDGVSLPGVDVKMFLEGEALTTLTTDSFGHFATDISPTQLHTIMLKKENFFSNQISFFPNQKTDADTLILHFDMPIRGIVMKKGIIMHNNTPVIGATVKAYQNGNVIAEAETDLNGNYTLSLRANQGYNFKVSKIGHFDNEFNVSTFGENAENARLVKTYLKKLDTKNTESVDDVYFEYNKANVNVYAKRELDKLAEFIQSNPNIALVELSAHTDNRGSAKFNQQLSQKRAEACVAYLVSIGVPKYKLIAVGYGESKPKIEAPLNEEEHAINRRVEFQVKKLYVR